VREADGFEGAPGLAAGEGNRFILIDPPFERGDDYARSAETLRRIQARQPDAVVMIWLPLKDLETFDAFLRDIGDCRDLLVAEVRLRPLRDPLKMNGCALVVASAPEGLDADLEAICGWTAATLGETGEARVWRPGC
jgi:23S rRNA (adenine2030-N6)-methyltransferase